MEMGSGNGKEIEGSPRVRDRMPALDKTAFFSQSKK
jgi:hypothetical protein